MGDPPRWIKADCAYCETQRTVDRCFLFKPDEDVRQVIGVSAGRALYSSRNRSKEAVDDRSLEKQMLYAITKVFKYL